MSSRLFVVVECNGSLPPSSIFFSHLFFPSGFLFFHFLSVFLSVSSLPCDLHLSLPPITLLLTVSPFLFHSLPLRSTSFPPSLTLSHYPSLHAHSLPPSLTRPLAHSLSLSLTPSLAHSLPLSLTPSLTYSHRFRFMAPTPRHSLSLLRIWT